MPATQIAPASKSSVAVIGSGSTSFSILTLIGVLKAAEPFLGPDRTWEPDNEGDVLLQNRLLELHDAAVRTAYGLTCMKYKADRKIEPINQWLKENGFDIELKEQPSEDGFAAGCILDILVNWVKSGQIDYVECATSGSYHDAFTLDEGFRLFDREGSHPEVQIETKEGYTLHLMVTDEHPGDSFDLFDAVQVVRSRSRSPWRTHYDKLTVPMVNLNQQPDLNWLLGLNTYDTKRHQYYIAEAVGQNKLRMNERGARAQSAVAVTIERCCVSTKQTYKVNRSFLFWIEKPGCELPLYCAFVEPDAWQNPGDLNIP